MPANTLEQLQALNQLGTVLNREPEFKDALSPALDQLVSLLGLNAGWVFLSEVDEGDARRGSFHLAAFSQLP